MDLQDYVHGYTEPESQRLAEQSVALEEILHHDVKFPLGAKVLEAGCGVGAQTAIMARRSPGARFSSLDMSPMSLAKAKERIVSLGLENVEFFQGNIYQPPFEPESFDAIFLCFVLEHLPDPVGGLRQLLKVLKPGGKIITIEGDHESTIFHPHSELAWRTIRCLIALQAATGADSLIGRRLYGLMDEAGIDRVQVTPCPVYVDYSRPELIKGFTYQTYIAMVESVREEALDKGLMTKEEWEQGIADLERTTKPDGSFFYTFFKGVGVKKFEG